VIVGSLLLILIAVVLLVIGLTNGSGGLLVGSIAASLLAAVALVVGARQDTAARAEEAFDDGYDDDVRDDAETVHPSQIYAAAGVRSGRGGQRAGDYGAPSTGDYDAPSATVGASAPPAYGGPPPPRAVEPYAPPPRAAEPYAPPPRAAEPARTDEPYAEPAYPTEPPRERNELARTASTPVDEFDEEDPPDEPAPEIIGPADAARVASLTTDVQVIDGRPRYHLAGCVHLLGRENEPLPVNEAVELGFTPCGLCQPATTLSGDSRR
jgi:hypothetical protein